MNSTLSEGGFEHDVHSPLPRILVVIHDTTVAAKIPDFRHEGLDMARSVVLMTSNIIRTRASSNELRPRTYHRTRPQEPAQMT